MSPGLQQHVAVEAGDEARTGAEVSTRLPEIPALTTARGGSPGAVSSRRASTSGHRRFESGVAAQPSVIELPTATTVPAARGFVTSTPARKSHELSVVSAGKLAEVARFPSRATYVVCTASGCRVFVRAESGRYRLTARSPSAGRLAAPSRDCSCRSNP